MARLPVVTETELDDAQRAVWDAVTGGARAAAHGGAAQLVDDRGGLIGPFNAWLHSPDLGLPAAQLGEAVRFRSTLDRRLLELAIVVVAAHWRCNFEMWAHRRYAIEAGIPADLLDAVQAGAEPRSVDPAEALVIEVSRELLRSGRLTGDRYEEAVRRLGTTGTVDLVTTVGYYTLVAINLNAFAVGLPPGERPPWPD